MGRRGDDAEGRSPTWSTSAPSASPPASTSRRCADAPGKRGFEAMNAAFHDHDLMLRIAGDTLALTPPLIISEDQIGEIVDKVGRVIRAVA